MEYPIDSSLHTYYKDINTLYRQNTHQLGISEITIASDSHRQLSYNVSEIIELMAEVYAFGTLHVDRLSKVTGELNEFADDADVLFVERAREKTDNSDEMALSS